jgi:mannose-6-phosphate isomerase-like protein (cupin superfamily)
MKGYVSDIEKLTLENREFRKVLYTAKHSQLVLMTLKPREDIGEEIHDVDQFFRIEKGEGKAIIDGNTYKIRDGFAVIVPAGAKHNIINTSKKHTLNLYTIYSPPHHKDQVLHFIKEVAEADDEHFDGKTTE